MRRTGTSLGAALLVLLALFLLVLPVWQLADWKETKSNNERTLQLLYQASSFQMELLGSTLGEAGQIRTAAQLNGWRQSAYAAGFVHDRLVQAVGEEKLAKLESADALLQWILRVQIGGDRPLRQDETELLMDTAKRFPALTAAYAGLMDDEGGIASSKRTALAQADRELAELIKKKMK